MKNKKLCLCMKIGGAGLAAFVILNVLCMFYYNVPAHCVSETKSTDHVWETNKFYSRGTEGFAWGITDENGFNNAEVYEKGEIDVLVMGSSHIEAFNVAQDKNTTALLNSKFQASGMDMHAYNIGVSGHNLVRCLDNLENAINEFGPQKYIVIETQSVKPSAESLRSVLEGTAIPEESVSTGIVGFLQKFPYLRLMYSQIKNAGANDETTDMPQTQITDNNQNEMYTLLDALMNNNAKLCKEKGIELVIFFNCSVSMDAQGNIVDRKDPESVEAFKTICENNGVIFVDMYDAFKKNAEETYKMPRGFSNSEIGEGHLNEEGHRVIADELFSLMCK